MKGGSSSTEKKIFRCNSSTSSSYPRFRRCRCGEKMILLTSKSLRNPGKNFWRCPFWDTENTCNYFQWADEEVTEDVSMRSDYTVDDLKAKNAKLKLKLMAERKAGKMKTYLVFFAWFLSFVVLAFCALKCNCNLK
ncbi:Zinc finger, GRF-type [Sesbania bispinosa]|nr:Zinc finger, GRF-type [Sesbania bispinosa]